MKKSEGYYGRKDYSGPMKAVVFCWAGFLVCVTIAVIIKVLI